MQDPPPSDSEDDGRPGVAFDGGHDRSIAGFGDNSQQGCGSSRRHVVLVHESDAEYRNAIVPFVRDGLQQRERVMYVLHDNTRQEVEAVLESGGVDVAAATDAGDLTFHSPLDVYQQDGTFEVEESLSLVETTARDAVVDGRYERLRITGEMTWVLDAEGDATDGLVEYESRLNDLPEDLPWVGLCQYDRTRFPDELLEHVLRTHPYQSYADAVESNPTYDPNGDYLEQPQSTDGATTWSNEGATTSEKADSTSPSANDPSASPSTASGSDARSTTGSTQDQSRLVETAVDRVRARRELSKRERALREIATASSDLVTGDRDAVVERSVETVHRSVAPALTGFAGYDSNADELRVEDARWRRDAPSSDHDLPAAVLDVIRSAFVTGDVEARTIDGADEASDELAARSLGDCAAFPVGKHGVLFVAETRRDAFDEPDGELCRTVTHALQTALERIAQERELDRRRAEIDRLDDINTTIRQINGALVEASTRETAQSLVCEHLASTDAFAFAWIGERAAESTGIQPGTWAGAPRGYLDAIYEESTGQQDESGQVAGSATQPRTPARTALEDGEACLVENVVTVNGYDRWRRVALDHGFASVLAVPLVHNETTYGVLSVGATEPNAFSDVERDVLAELGSTVAYAIDATETKASLHGDHVTDVGIRITESGDQLRRLARTVDGTLEVETVLPADDDAIRLFFVVPNAPTEGVLEGAADCGFVESIREISDRDRSALFETVVHVDPGFPESLEAFDASVVQLSVTEDAVDLVVRLPDSTTVSAFVARLGEAYPELDVTAIQRDRDPAHSKPTFRAELEAELTDRQLQALRVAYHNGYFAWPRDSSGEDVADDIGVSQPTFSRHIRVGHRKLLSLLFDDSP